MVINTLAQQKLKERKGIQADVVPNVFEFDETHWVKDSFNEDFRRSIGLKEDDLLFLQATRVVPRKGIELAIDYIAALDQPENREKLKAQRLYNGKRFTDESRIVLVLAGYSQDDPTGTYLQRLKDKAEAMGVELLAIEDQVDSERSVVDGKKIYSLWDTYVHADFVTYPSLWEGWGNQLLEAIVAKLPVLIFEYPVYALDIKNSGFELVSLGDTVSNVDANNLKQVSQEKIDAAAAATLPLLIDKEHRESIVNKNYEIGRETYSMQALSRYLGNLMAKFE